MKAKEFKPYINENFNIEINDLDEDFLGNTSKRIETWVGNVSYVSATKEELYDLWDKEVVAIDYKNYMINCENGKGTKTLVLSVSKYTDKERSERELKREIARKRFELEELTGKKVVVTEEDV